ncbi:MAG: M23 family metallopeptidase [Clostridia bacterium]
MLLQSGSSTSHSGIDIGAPTGSKIIASIAGTVIFTGFKGAGGFTITIENGEFQTSYCHVSPQFIVYPGMKIMQGQVISSVGPYNVYGVPNNPYKDKNGNPTNGASTGPHLHFTLKKNGTPVNPLDYLSS